MYGGKMETAEYMTDHGTRGKKRNIITEETLVTPDWNENKPEKPLNAGALTLDSQFDIQILERELQLYRQTA